jgi:hypothetical protein
MILAAMRNGVLFCVHGFNVLYSADGIGSAQNNGARSVRNPQR